MHTKIRAVAMTLAVALSLTSVQAQTLDAADAWRTFAMKVDVGTELEVRLQNGQRFAAVLVGTRDDGVVLLPKTRLAVPAQVVPYDAIVSLQRRNQGHMSAGKAAAIGVGAGGAAFLGMLLLALATLD